MKLTNLVYVFAILLFFSCGDQQFKYADVPSDKILKRQRIHEDGPGWEPCEIASLTILVTGDCGEVYTEAIDEALFQYNNVPNTGINIEITTNEEQADIILNCFCTPGTLVGGWIGSDLDSEGKSEEIEINACLDIVTHDGCPEEIDVCGAAGIVMHEIMHAIGFYHNGDTSTPSDLVEGTNEEDPNSIINAGDHEDWDWCNIPCEFSEFDILALQTVYPCDCYPLENSTALGEVCEVGEEKTFCAPSEGEFYGWELPDNFSLVEMNGNCVTIMVDYLEPRVELKAHLANNTCGYTYDIIITHPDTPDFDIVWLDPVCVGDRVSFFVEPLSANQQLQVENWYVIGSGLNITGSSSTQAVAHAMSPGTATICADVANQCGATVTKCSLVTILSGLECVGDGGPF